jgi:hypothetical protein
MLYTAPVAPAVVPNSVNTGVLDNANKLITTAFGVWDGIRLREAQDAQIDAQFQNDRLSPDRDTAANQAVGIAGLVKGVGIGGWLALAGVIIGAGYVIKKL